MYATQLIELTNRSPFEPLTIHLNNGTTIHVEHPYSISATANSPTCLVFDDEGVVRFVAYRNIAEIVTTHANGSAS